MRTYVNSVCLRRALCPRALFNSKRVMSLMRRTWLNFGRLVRRLGVCPLGKRSHDELAIAHRLDKVPLKTLVDHGEGGGYQTVPVGRLINAEKPTRVCLLLLLILLSTYNCASRHSSKYNGWGYRRSYYVWEGYRYLHCSPHTKRFHVTCSW